MLVLYLMPRLWHLLESGSKTGGYAVLCWESGGTEQQVTHRCVAWLGLLPSALAVPSKWWLLSQL